MSNLKPGGPKTNHKKGIEAAHQALKREAAEKRNADYQKLSKGEKMDRNSVKVKTKLEGENP